jgi:hypothetical protein
MTEANSDWQRTAVDAWIFGYPLVLMDLTRRVMGAPVNTFHHQRAFPDHTFTDVVSPNADTLHSSAWLDLRPEPVVLSVPATRGRFWMMPALSAWTDVFADPGGRTTGDEGADLAFCPPGWRGDLPREVARIDAPTALVWLIGRTATAGTRDYLAVHALQDQYLLTPLSVYDDAQPPPRLVEPWPTTEDTTPPVDQVARLDGPGFFARLFDLLADNPPTGEDAVAMTGLAVLRDSADDPAVAAAIAAAPVAGQAELRRVGAEFDRQRVDGWSIPRGLGRYGTDYGRRAYLAFLGLGANLDADALYPHTNVDSEGRALSGAHSYQLHFGPGQLPPVHGFWSLTLYDDKQFFVDNPIDRYAIGGRDPLAYNDDGSLDLWVSAEEPADERLGNWLPAPTGSFNMTLRAYWPDRALLDGAWAPPAPRRLA